MLEKWLPLLIYVVVFVAMIVLFSILSKRTNKVNKVEYDERQEITRNKGYKYAFIILAVYIGLYGFFDYATGIKWCDTYIGCFIGIFISTTFLVVFSIFNDSYLPIKTKNGSYYVRFIFLFLIFSSVAIVNLFNNKNILVEGKLTSDSIFMFIAIMFFIIFIAFIIKDLSDKKKSLVEKI